MAPRPSHVLGSVTVEAKQWRRTQRKQSKRVWIEWSTAFVWVAVAVWAAMLWICDWHALRSVRVIYTNGVIEGLRPPVSRQVAVWLYAPGMDVETVSEVKSRTWPQNYDFIPYKKNRNANDDDNERPKKSTELRHLSTYPSSCKPRAAWHKLSFPTCNAFHALDFEAGLIAAPSEGAEDTSGELHIEYKFSGGTRSSWLVYSRCDGDDCAAEAPHLILKTLRWPVVADEVVYNHQRIDALASERLTSSPHVIDIYGACGLSAINEYADGGSFGKMFRRDHESISDAQLLVYARDAALSLADIHEIDGRRNVTSLVHHDFSAKNFLTVNGKLKVSDFNDGQLLRWDVKTGKRCFGFNWDGLCGTNTERTHRRAPEECMGDKYRRLTSERVEVYHLGAFFFYLLTDGGWPYSQERDSKGKRHARPNAEKAKKWILAGRQPALPLNLEQSNSTAIKGIVRAMRKAFTFDPVKRPSARTIAEFLTGVANKVEGVQL